MKTIVTTKPIALNNILANAPREGAARSNHIRRALARVLIDALISMIEVLNERSDDLDAELRNYQAAGSYAELG